LMERKKETMGVPKKKIPGQKMPEERKGDLGTKIETKEKKKKPGRAFGPNRTEQTAYGNLSGPGKQNKKYKKKERRGVLKSTSR